MQYFYCKNFLTLHFSFNTLKENRLSTLRPIAGHGHRQVPLVRNTDELRTVIPDAFMVITNTKEDVYSNTVYVLMEP